MLCKRPFQIEVDSLGKKIDQEIIVKYFCNVYTEKGHFLVSKELEINEPPDTLLKNGFHLALKIDPPKTLVQLGIAASPTLPNTLLGIRKHYYQEGIGHLGKAVGQLLVSGCVNYWQSPILLQHLASLAQAYDKLRQELQYTPVDALRRADEEAAGKK